MGSFSVKGLWEEPAVPKSLSPREFKPGLWRARGDHVNATQEGAGPHINLTNKPIVKHEDSSEFPEL